MEYRRTVELDRDKDYVWVVLGPIPGYPTWHEQSEETQYPFPTEQAAFRFAEANKKSWPGREIKVVTPDGNKFVI